MKKRRTREVLLMVLFFCLTNIAFGQIQTKTDTILCHNVLDSSIVGGAVCFKRTPFCKCLRYKI